MLHENRRSQNILIMKKDHLTNIKSLIILIKCQNLNMLLKRVFQSQGNNYCGTIMASKNKKVNILVSNYNNKTEKLKYFKPKFKIKGNKK